MNRFAALALALLLAGGALAQPGPAAPQPTRYDGGSAILVEPGYLTQTPLQFVRGVATPFHVVLANLGGEPVEGTLALEPSGALALDATQAPFRLQPGDRLAFPFLGWINGTLGALRVTADGLPGAYDEQEWRALAPLSVEMRSPEKESVNVGAKEPLPFLANVTNLGNAPASALLALQLRDQAVAERLLDPPLQPGETREVDFGQHEPPAPQGPYEQQQSSYPVFWRVMHVDGERNETATRARIEDGRLAELAQARGHLSVSKGPTVRLVVDHAELGEPSRVRAILRHDGDAPIDVRFDMGAHSPVLGLRPEWRIEPVRREVHLEPGDRVEIPLAFTPRVAARVEISAAAWGPNHHVVDQVRLDFASPVRVAPVDGAWSVAGHAGDDLAWSLDVTATEEIPDGQLRVLVAPRHARQAYDGLIRPDDIIRATVTSPGGDDASLAAGETRRYDLALAGRASGTYLVVPYVERDGVAYLGALTQEQLQALYARPGMSYEAQNVQAVVVVANVLPVEVPSALALAPAGVVLLGAMGLWAGRRWKVR